MTDAKPRPFRVLPAVLPENEHFWMGGAEGELRFLRCEYLDVLVVHASQNGFDLAT